MWPSPSVCSHLSSSALTSHHCWVSFAMHYQIYSQDCFCQKSLVLRGLLTIPSHFSQDILCPRIAPGTLLKKRNSWATFRMGSSIVSEEFFSRIPQAVMNLPLAQPALPVWAELDLWSVSSESVSLGWYYTSTRKHALLCWETLRVTKTGMTAWQCTFPFSFKAVFSY